MDLINAWKINILNKQNFPLIVCQSCYPTYNILKVMVHINT